MIALLTICTFATMDQAFGVAAIFAIAAISTLAFYCYGSASAIACLYQAFHNLNVKELPETASIKPFVESAQEEANEVFLQNAFEHTIITLQDEPPAKTAV